MKINIAITFDSDTQIPVRNEMHGGYSIVPRHVGLLGNDYEQKRAAWLEFCKEVHNPSSLVSADLHMKLTKEMDNAQMALAPHMNTWMIARKGLSLN